MEIESHKLLTEFEHILETDAMINEIGFVHPSQFGKLDNEVEGSHPSPVTHNKVFWYGNHKLGISTDSFVLLYKEARQVFMTSLGNCKLHETSQHISPHFQSKFEKQVLAHSKAVLLLSSDFGTAWNSRKVVLSNKQALWMFEDELSLSALVLSRSPKSDHAWCHRRWAMNMIAERCSCFPKLTENESMLVEQIAEKCKMNYRAWNHRSFLVSSMTREQVLHELRKTKNWAALHIADNCCFHYRRRLLLKLFLANNMNKDFSSPCDDIYHVWKDGTSRMILQGCRESGLYLAYQELTPPRAMPACPAPPDVEKLEELDWDGMLIMEFIGREALWLHRRFLSTCWIDHFAKEKASGADFVQSELEIVKVCSNIPDDCFGDFEEQTILAASYALWLTKKLYKECGIDIREETMIFKNTLLKAFPQRVSLYNL